MNDEVGHSVLQTIDSGYLICGYSDQFQYKYEDVYLIKTDDSGNILWEKNYGSSALEQGYNINATSDNGYIIAAERYSPMYNTLRAYLLRIDFYGDTLWTKKFSGMGDANARCAIQTDDGGYAFCGATSVDVDRRAYLVKLSESGELVWEKAFANIRNEWSYDMKQTIDGGFILCGGTEISPGYDDFLIIKTDSSGDTIWTRHYGGPGYDAAYAILQSEVDGNYYVGGVSWNANASSLFDMLILKLDHHGDTIWTKRFGGAGGDFMGSMDFKGVNEIIACGWTNSFGNGGFDLYLFKIDTDGNFVWSQTFGETGSEISHSVHPTYDEGFILSGYTTSFGNGNSDVYFIKTDSDGLMTNIFDLKYDLNTTGCIHPNPNNGCFWIDLPEGQGDIKIYDTQGQIVYWQQYYQDHSSSGTYIDLRNMPKAFYILRLNRNNEFLQSCKIIIN